MRLLRLGSIAMIAALPVLGACSSSNPGGPPTGVSTTTAKTTVPPSVPDSALGGPKVLALTGPALPVQCNAPTSVELHWESAGAATVTLRIDLEPIFATYRDGAKDELVPLACDGKPHVYTLTARAADGRTATRALTITERTL